MTEVRLFQPQDEPYLLSICSRTGLKGKPIPSRMVNGEQFARLILGPYLKLAADTCWVCVSDGMPVGYFAGNCRRSFAWRSVLYKIRPFARVYLDRLSGAYDRHFANWLLFRSWKEMPPNPRSSVAHFHFNLLPDHRQQGFGKECLQRFEEKLQQHGLRELHSRALCRRGEEDEAVWFALGFEEFSRTATTMLEGYLPGPTDWVCFTKSL